MAKKKLGKLEKGQKTQGRPSAKQAKSSARPATLIRHDESHGRPVVIAGVGASAGGLEAFSQLLQALPSDPDIAIVLVQHLAPQHESALPVLLSGKTHLPVVHAAEGMRVEANKVYVIPPNVQMGIRDDVLHLLPRPS